MDNPNTKFMSIVSNLTSTDDNIHLGKMMSAPGLKYKDKVFAFFTKEESMGFRLGDSFDIQKAGVKNPKQLSPFKTKPPLKNWWIVNKEEMSLWEQLTENALTYTKTL